MSKKSNVIEKFPNVIQKDAFDGFAFENVAHAKKIKELTKAPKNPDGTQAVTDGEVGALVQDVFSSVYKMEPQLTQDGPSAQKGVIQTMMNLPEYQELRAATQMDEISSALGVTQLAPGVVTQLVEVKARQEQRRKEREEAQKNGEPGPQGSGPNGEDTIEDIMGENGMASLRQGLRKSLQQAQEESDKWGDAANTWGLNPSELATIPFDQRFELAQKITQSAKFKNISDLAGRMKNIVNSSAATVPTHGNDEIVDIGQGDDIGRVIPSELLKLRRTPALFYKDMLEGKLLTYNLRGVEDLGKGPIVVCVDKSGSMEGARDQWATAITLALMNLAERQKRAFSYLAFDTRVVGQKFWPKGNPPDLSDKIGVAEVAANGGGTEFYPVLKKAFEMRAKEPELKPADIVFITDGQAYMDEEQLAEIATLKKQGDVRIFSIAINDGYYKESDMGILGQFSDQVAELNSTGDLDIVKKVVAVAAKKKVA